MSNRERAYIDEVFDSNFIAPVGPMLDAFEQDFATYTGIPHGVAVASGTAAIHLALRVLGVGQGDQVWTSSLTFIGGVSPIVFLGAEPVFFDCDASTWTMDTHLLAEEMKKAARNGTLPKAVLPTDLYGQCADYDRIRKICAAYDVPVIADSAESLGATYRGKSAGYHADLAAYSFNGNKIITASGGGMLASHNNALVDHARRLSTQAREPVPHYEHNEIGYNYRMSNVMAAIGRGQLEVLEERVTMRRKIFDYYRKGLGDVPGISFMPETDQGRANRWLSVLTVDQDTFGASPEDIRQALEAENIEARPVWKPMHMQPVFKDANMIGGGVSETIFRQGLCLPSGTQMSWSDLDRVIDAVTHQKDAGCASPEK